MFPGNAIEKPISEKIPGPIILCQELFFFLLISGSSGLVLFSLAQLCKLFFFLNLHFYTVKILQRILLGEIAQHLRTVFVIHKFDPSRKYSILEPLSSNKKKN